MESDLTNLLSNKGAIILDGSTGANLTRRGMPAGVCVEQWILDNPDVLCTLQTEFIQAGSDIILAPTFGANSAVLKRHGLEIKVREFNLSLSALSQQVTVKAGHGLVAGDMSPTGLFMRPFGDSTHDEISEIFYQQAMVLDEAGVDLFFLETQINLAEARAALLGIRQASKKPVFVSMTIDACGKTMSGNPIDACISALQAAGAAAVGCNCSTGPKEMLENLRKAMPYAAVPVIAKANAGMPVQTDNGIRYDLSAEGFSQFALEMVKSGVKIIGGCCGTTPEHISLLKQKLQGVEIPPVARHETGLHCLSNEKQIFPVNRDTVNLPDKVITVTPDLADDLMEAEDEGYEVIRLRVNTLEDVELLIENAFMVNCPLMLSSDNMEALDLAVKTYPGVVLIDHEVELTDISEAFFRGKYGAVKL